ncbi:hypothetical protein AeNC1_014267, partial [Aphanomyces euteiches]
MSRTTPIHHPYSFKKEVLDAWKDAQKEEGMTKVKVSRMHRVTISTFDKWLAKADEIAKVENGSSKHLRGRSKRGAYSKERPNNEKKGSDQHVNQLADQEADEQNNQLTDQQADRQDDQLADQEANQHVNELADQEANHHVNELTDQQATQHINQLIDQQPGQHIVQLTDEPLIDRQTERPVNQLTFFGDLFDEDLQNSDGLDETKRKRPRLYNDYESADEDNYRKAYTHIDQSLPLRGRTNKARSFSSGSKYNSGIHNDRCYR